VGVKIAEQMKKNGADCGSISIGIVRSGGERRGRPFAGSRLAVREPANPTVQRAP